MGTDTIPLPKSVLPNGYRRDGVSRMQRILETGRFDEHILRRIATGVLDKELAELGYEKRRGGPSHV
jgi:hypothetical protein